MKRRISLDDTHSRDLKRHSSTALCSVVNAIEDDLDDLPKEIDEIKLGNVVSLTHLPLPRPSSIHSISTSSSNFETETDDFTLFHCFTTDEENDDDDEEEQKETLVVKPTSILEGTLICTEISASNLEPQGTDFDTAVVFEAGLKHFDRNNRCHMERPLRVTSILEFLTNSTQNISERCRFFDQLPGEGTAEKAFLNDEDYLSVHLPGYMQRYEENC